MDVCKSESLLEGVPVEERLQRLTKSSHPFIIAHLSEPTIRQASVHDECIEQIRSQPPRCTITMT